MAINTSCPLPLGGLTLNVYFIPLLRVFLWIKPQSPIAVTCLMTCLLLAAFWPSHFHLPYECFLGSPPRGTTALDPGLRVCLGERKPRHHSSFCKETRLEGTKVETLGKKSPGKKRWRAAPGWRHLRLSRVWIFRNMKALHQRKQQDDFHEQTPPSHCLEFSAAAHPVQPSTCPPR